MNRLLKFVLILIIFSLTNFVSLECNADVSITASESKVCNIYYDFPSDLELNEFEVILKDSNGNIQGSKVFNRHDGILFENVWYGDYYIEIVELEDSNKYFPIHLNKDSLYDAHIKKELTLRDNFFTEEECKLILSMGYSGTNVPPSVIKDIRGCNDLVNSSSEQPTNSIDDVDTSTDVSLLDDSESFDSLIVIIFKILLYILLLLIFTISSILLILIVVSLIYYSYKRIRKYLNKEVN